MRKVIDANVFIHGRGNLDAEEVLTVPEVLEELESKEARNTASNIDYKLVEPQDSPVEKVREASEKINSPTSETDERLVAVALERELELVSDDRAVQNLCLHLDVGFSGFLDEATGSKVEWERICENCGSKAEEKCQKCGSSSTRLRQVRCSSG